MLKVEVDIKKRVIRVEAKGSMQHVYAEMGMATQRFYQILSSHNTQETALEMMRRLADNSALTEADMEQRLEECKRENPEIYALAEIMADGLFGEEA